MKEIDFEIIRFGRGRRVTERRMSKEINIDGMIRRREGKGTKAHPQR